jgi:L-gulonolactone oxidase
MLSLFVIVSDPADLQPMKPAPSSWLWDSFFGYHVIQFMLYIGRFMPSFNKWTGRFAVWLVSAPFVRVDEALHVFNLDCRYRQYTTEWSIPYDNTQACVRDLKVMFDAEYADPKGARPHFPIEIRFTEADDIWLSPSYGQRSCWIGIVQYR